MGTQTRLRLPKSPFFEAIRKSGLLTPDDLIAVVMRPEFDDATAHDPIRLASLFVRMKLLTKFQAMQLMNGRTQGFIMGPYKILSGFRQDRVGMVFHAQDSRSKKQVFLKVLPTDRVSDPTILKAFRTEVQSAAQVDHPSVAMILDMGVWGQTHYVVSEHVPWPTLDKVVAENGPLSPDVAAQTIAQVAIALKHAHGKGLCHRDIKPGNIAVGPHPRIKLLDLGLTHMLENPWKQVTRRISTKEYAEEIDHVAPEQAWGCDTDARSDIYSLGSTFYYLLTGCSPFPGSAAQKMADRQVQGIPKPSLVRPGIPKAIDDLVTTMGEKNPADRYPNAQAVIVAMQSWLPVTDWVTLGLSTPQERANAETLPSEPHRNKRGGFWGRMFGRS